MSNNINKRLHAGIVALNVDINAAAEAKILQYLELLLSWNRKINLTAIKTLDEMLKLHVFDSLAVLPFISGSEILDVGSGAGLPGIILAIAAPNLNFTLLDANSKKIAFLRHVITALNLSNVTAIHARIESFSDGRFTTVISRAFAALDKFVEVSRHTLLSGVGVMLAMKGREPTEELGEIAPKFAEVVVKKLIIPGLTQERHLVILKLKD